MTTEIAPPRHLSEVERDATVLLSGRVHPELAESVASELGVELCAREVKEHGNGELYARIEESVRGKNVFIIQAHASHNGIKLEEAITEQRFMARAAFGADANHVTVVAPYLGHSRGDRKSKGREVVPVADVIENFESAGVKRMMVVDLHSPQVQTIFRGGSFDHLTAQGLLRHAYRIDKELNEENRDEFVVVAPDSGAVKTSNYHARELEVDAVYMEKERERSDSTRLKANARLVNNVADKRCVVFDDMIDGGSTMVAATDRLRDSAVKEISVAVTHPILSSNAAEKLLESSVDTFYMTDTLPMVENALEVLGEDRLKIVRVGPMIARSIFEVITDGSISSLYDDMNHL